MNFLYQNNLPEDLKSKRSVASFAGKPWFTISRFLITGPCEGLHSKQLELSKSFLENIEIALIGLLCSLQSNPAPAVYGQRVNCFEFSTSSCRSLLHNFSCLVQKVIYYKEQKLSQCTGEQNYVIKKKQQQQKKNPKHSDYYYLSSREMINILSSKLAGLLRNF